MNKVFMVFECGDSFDGGDVLRAVFPTLESAQAWVGPFEGFLYHIDEETVRHPSDLQDKPVAVGTVVSMKLLTGEDATASPLRDLDEEAVRRIRITYVRHPRMTMIFDGYDPEAMLKAAEETRLKILEKDKAEGGHLTNPQTTGSSLRRFVYLNRDTLEVERRR